MKKSIAALAVAASLLLLTGCGEAMYGKPGDLPGIKKFKEFAATCEEAGGVIKEGARDWYTCDMGGAG